MTYLGQLESALELLLEGGNEECPAAETKLEE